MQSEAKFFAELGRLAGSQQRENQVSRTFAACFNESPGFRRQIVGLFWRTLRGHLPVPNPESWQCSPEVPTPVPGGGRVDFHFMRKDAHGVTVVGGFFVESKVEAPPTRHQVEKYLRHGVRPLIVLTKYHPRGVVEAAGVHNLRWQEVHRALQRPDMGGAVDRQVCRWMTDYLEELDMAYREDLSLADLEACGRLFRTITSTREWSQMASRGVFEVAHACTGILDDLHRDFVDRHQKLASAPYSNGKTHYGKYIEPSNRSVYHHLVWSITKTPWTKWQLSCSICWPDDVEGDTAFWVYLAGTAVKGHESAPSVKKFFSRGKLDRAKLLKHLEACARSWGVI